MLGKITDEKEWQSFIRQFSIKPELDEDHTQILKELSRLVVNAIKKNIRKERFGILFSGGVDSSLIAQLCRKEKKDFICYTAALEEAGLKKAEDLIYAKKVAKKLNLKLKIKTIGLVETEEYIKKILKILKEPNVVKVGVALPFYIAFEMAKKDNITYMFSGLGSEELFAGYERHINAKDLNKECFNGLLLMYERDISRDRAIAKAHKIKLKLPYLDEDLIRYSLRIPAEFKLSAGQNKIILREVAEQLGLKEFAWRKKRAAQYGSRFDRGMEKLAKRSVFKYKQEYLKNLLSQGLNNSNKFK